MLLLVHGSWFVNLDPTQLVSDQSHCIWWVTKTNQVSDPTHLLVAVCEN